MSGSVANLFLSLTVSLLSQPNAAGGGIARRYPSDRGIGNDPSVVLFENFDADSIERIAKRWESVQNQEILSLSSHEPPNSDGGRSLLMTHVGGKSNGAHLHQSLEPGYEQKMFPPEERRGQLRLIASRDGRDGAVTVHQDVELYVATLTAGEQVTHELQAGRHAWVQVARGSVTVNGRLSPLYVMAVVP